MKKKRKITRTEYLVYKKQHAYDDVIAAEEAKISNEKLTYARLQMKSKQQIQKNIQAIITNEDPEFMENDLEIPEEEIIANRKIRNAKTHKNRLNGLKEFEED
ncbi:MAG: hypothetical protein Q7U53_00695 [Anaerolineaceae bacterium]|nr:hypothetical protein [Anaerolineaceae bacterium]